MPNGPEKIGEKKAEPFDAGVNDEFMACLTVDRLRDLASEDMRLYVDHAPDRGEAPTLSDIDWAVLQRLRDLGINPSAFEDAMEAMGWLRAMLAVIVIDRNRAHPTRPIGNCGGALRAFTRRHRQGALDLRASIFGIWGLGGQDAVSAGPRRWWRGRGLGPLIRGGMRSRAASAPRRQARCCGPNRSPRGTATVRVPPPGAAVLGRVVEHVAALAERGEVAEAVAARIVLEMAAGQHHPGHRQSRDWAQAVEAGVAAPRARSAGAVRAPAGRARRASVRGPRPTTGHRPDGSHRARAAARSARRCPSHARSGSGGRAPASRSGKASASRA